MKEKCKQRMALLLSIAILFTSGIFSEKPVFAATSATGGEEYPYYCRDCRTYFSEKTDHYCREKVTCSACGGKGYLEGTCTYCGTDGKAYCFTNRSLDSVTYYEFGNIPSENDPVRDYFSEYTALKDSVSYEGLGTNTIREKHVLSCAVCGGAAGKYVYAYEPDRVNLAKYVTKMSHGGSVHTCFRCSGTRVAKETCILCNGTGKAEVATSSKVPGTWDYRVSFDAHTNGGLSSGDGTLYVSGAYTREASRPGYEFIGWSSTGSYYTAQLELNITEPGNYCAMYRKALTSDFYDAEGKQTGAGYIYNNSTLTVVTVSAPKQREYPGWDAIGWAIGTEADAEVQDYHFFRNGNIYYGIYKKDCKAEFSMGSDDRGTAYAGTDTTPEAQTKTAYTNSFSLSDIACGNITLPTAPSWKNHAFLGWSDGSTTYAAGAEVALCQDMTFTAQWELESNQVSLDAQGATTQGTGSVEAVYGAAMPAITKPEKKFMVTFNKNTTDPTADAGSSPMEDHHVFGGYYDAISGGTQYYDARGASSRDWDKTRDSTLYARWTDNGIVLPEATRTGYTFKGWAASPEASSGTAAGQNYRTGSDTTLYAVWEVESYTIRYTLNGGTVSGTNPSTYNVETETFTLNNPTRTGYLFAGWTGSNGTTKQTSVSIAKGSTGNKSYTANWTARTDTAYKVKHYLMDLDGRNYTLKETENKTGTSDAELSLSSLKKEYTGFTYKEGNVGSNVVAKTTIAADGSREIFLYYARNQYKFTLGTLSHVKAEGTSNTGTYFFGAAITLKAQPDEGYEWVTWEGTGESNKMEKDTGFSMPTSHVTMTPKVTAKNYSITYTLGGGTNAVGNPSGYTVESADITLADPARTGYDFTGWTGSNGTVAQKNVTIPKGTTGNKSYTANWKVITYDISYLMNKGTNSSANPAAYTVESSDITLVEPVRAGYDFEGWTGSNGETPQKSVEIPKGSTGNKSYTANWTARTDTPYQIVIHRETMDGDYSDTAADVTVSKKGTTDTKVAAAGIAADYQYEGFTYSHARAQDSAAGGAEAAEMNIDGEGDAVLHLYYSRNAYQLTIGDYDESKITTENTDTILLYGEKIKLRATALSGYKFSRWDSSDTGVQPDVKTSSATLTMAASDLTMTPLAADTVYTIDFKANDTNSHTPENNVRAVSVPENQEYGYSESVTIPGCTRNGFTFLGWSETRTGPVTYTAGQTISGLSSTDKDIVTLYAQWKEHQYRIEFSANDDASTAHNPSGNVEAVGTTPSTAFYYYTDNIALPGCGFTRTGFTFLGWSVAEGSNAVEYKPGDFAHNVSAAENGKVTFYAAWTEKSYPVAFNPGDSYCYGSEDGIDAKVSDREAMDTERVYYTDGFAMPSCRYIRKGFTFLGWSGDRNASKKTYMDSTYRGELQPGDEVPDLDVAEAHVYYPVWRENKYTVIYHANDGGGYVASGSMASRTAYYTEPFCLAKNGFQRTGFVFRGWSAAEGSSEVSYAKEEEVCKLAASGDVSLYAAWKEISYRISFVPNDSYCYGADEGISAKVSNPDAMEDMTLGFTETASFPECGYIRKGFTFLGWSADKSDSLNTYDADVTAIQPGTPLQGLFSTSGDALVYYPVWKENKYTIVFDSNDEGNAAEPDNAPEANGVVQTMEDVYYTQEVTLPRNQFTRTGFDYKGWSAAKGSNTLAYHDRETVRGLSGRDGDMVTMYAAWKEHSYTVNFRPADGCCYASGKGIDVRVTDGDAMQPVILKYTENWSIATAYERTGFTFLGYSRTNDNQEVYGGGYEAPFAAGDTLAKLSAQDGEEVTLFAIWEENTYQIRFHANDRNNAYNPAGETAAEGSTADTGEIYYTESFVLPENGFQREGFTFLGWAGEEGSNTVQKEDRETVRQLSSKDNDRIHLYAAWKEHSYQVQFVPNDGRCYGSGEGIEAKVSNPDAMQPATLHYTEDYTLPECGYRRKGFTFLGYSLTDGTEFLYLPSGREKSALEEKAEEMARRLGDTPEDIREERAAPLSAGDLISRISAEENGTVIIYPVWKEHRYDLHFHANDAGNGTKAEGIMEDIPKVYYTEKRMLPENTYQRTGFTFLGWAEEGSREVVYEDGETICKETSTDNAVLGLYAVWSEHQYHILFDPNDSYSYGTEEKVTNPVSMEGITVSHTDAFVFPECIYEREGFVFRGWTLDKEDGKKLYQENPAYDRNYQAPYQPGDTVSGLERADGDMVTFYPVWEEISYRVNFHANDSGNAHTPGNAPEAEGSMEDITKVYYTEEVTLPENAYTRTGFTWKGWGVTEKSNAVVYTDRQKLSRMTKKNGEEIDLYAAWQEARYTISYDANDGYCYGIKDGVCAGVDRKDAMKDSSVTLYYTDPYEIPSCGYKRGGFSFLGWTENGEDGKKLYPEDKEYDQDFRASWQPGDAVYGLSAEDGGEVLLYPLWKEHKMTVRFDKNADDAVWQADGSRKEVYYTEPWSIEDVPYRTGYQLVGYAEDKGAENADYQELTDQKMLAGKDADGETKTLYALWDANRLLITYESEGVVSAYKESAVYGQSCTVADEKTTGFADLEKTFLGWSTETVEGYGTKMDVDYKAGAESSQCFGLADTEEENRLHLYAVWRENTYDVFFDTAGGTGKAPATMGGIRYTEEIILPQNELVKEGYTFAGWSYQAGADRTDFQAEEAVSKLPECNRDGAVVTLHAVWLVTPPEIIAQTETGDFGAEVKPGIPVTVSVSAVGLDRKYQWYRMEGTTEAAIEGADSRIYTISAEDVTEKNDGAAYRCAITNEGGQAESRPFFLHVYGTPDAPAVSYSDVNERGWSSKDVRITLSGSTIKGSTRQVRYAYSTDGSTWKDCDGRMVWEKNTQTEGETVSFKAYNKDCPELESPTVSYTIRKDDEKPTITDIASLAVAKSAVKAECAAVTGSSIVTEDTAVTDSAIAIEDEGVTEDAVVTDSAIVKKDTAIADSTMLTENTSTKDSVIVSGSTVTMESSAAAITGHGNSMGSTGAAFPSAMEGMEIEAGSAITESGIVLAEDVGVEAAAQTSVYAMELQEGVSYPVVIHATDSFSGIYGYAVAREEEEILNWQESSRFELTAGSYRAYAMDMAGNAACQDFTVYVGGYVLCSGSGGSYTEGGSSHVVGEGTAAWDSPDMDRSKIESIVIEDGITEIPDGFFEGFTNLKDLMIPGSVVIIGEHAFDSVPEDMVIRAPEGSEGEKAAENHHYTEYDISIDGTASSSIHIHYRDNILLPEDGMETDGKTLVGWGTEPGEKVFGKEDAVSGLTGEMNGRVTICPVYTDAYLDEDGRLHITGDDTKYLDDILKDKDKITEIIIEEGVTVLPEQIPDVFKNLTSLTLPESLRDIPEDRLDGMPDQSVIHAPEGSTAAEEAGKNHRTEYDILMNGTEEVFHVHYRDSIKLPETAPEKEGYIFIGWGTTPDRKEFEPAQIVSGLTGTPDGKVTLYPVYEKEKVEIPEEPKDPESPEKPEENNGSGNGGNGSWNYLPSVPKTLPEPDREDGEDGSGQEDDDKIGQTGKENGEDTGTKDVTEGQNGFYVSGGQEYSSLEDIIDSLEEKKPSGSQEGEKTEIYAYGNSTLENNLDIPETIRLVVNETLIIDGDVTLSGGDMVILPGAEVTINGSLTADADSGIYINGSLTVNGKLITSGCLLIGENGFLHVTPDGTCMLLPEAALENHGTVDGSIDSHTGKESKGSIAMKTKLPSIVIERGSTCKVKPITGVTRWTVRNKKIASLKKQDGKLILTGKKNGKTVLIGKKNGKTYRYVIRVKKKEYNHQIKLAVVGEEKSNKCILIKSGAMVKEVAVKDTDGKLTLKLLRAGRDVKWKLSGDGTLKKKGKKAVVTMGSGSCTVTAKYHGKTYRCELYR